MSWTDKDTSELRELLRAVQFDGVAMSVEEVGRVQARIDVLEAAPAAEVVVEAPKKTKK